MSHESSYYTEGWCPTQSENNRAGVSHVSCFFQVGRSGWLLRAGSMFTLPHKRAPDPSTALGIQEVPDEYLYIKSLNASERRWPGRIQRCRDGQRGNILGKGFQEESLPGRSRLVFHLVTSKLVPGKPEPTALPSPYPQSPVLTHKI